MSLWNGPIHNWLIECKEIDENMMFEPHGQCSFNLPIQHFNDTGRHDFLDWSLKSIIGRFFNGKIDGEAKLITWQGQIIWVTFKDGILHGPAYQTGLVLTLDSMNVSKHQSKFEYRIFSNSMRA